MQKIKQLYRKNYSGEDVIVDRVYSRTSSRKLQLDTSMAPKKVFYLWM